MILKSFVGVWAEVDEGVDFRIPTDVTSLHLPSVYHRNVAKISAGGIFFVLNVPFLSSLWFP